MNRNRLLTSAKFAVLGIGCAAAISTAQAATLSDLLDPSWWFGDSHDRDWRYSRYRHYGPGPWYGGGWGNPWFSGYPGFYGYPYAPTVAATSATTSKEELPE